MRITLLLWLCLLPLSAQEKKLPNSPAPKQTVEQSFWKRDAEWYKSKHFWVATGLTWQSSWMLYSASKYVSVQQVFIVSKKQQTSFDYVQIKHGWDGAAATGGAFAVTGITLLTRKWGEPYCQKDGQRSRRLRCFASRYGPAIGYSTLMFIASTRHWEDGGGKEPLF